MPQPKCSECRNVINSADLKKAKTLKHPNGSLRGVYHNKCYWVVTKREAKEKREPSAIPAVPDVYTYSQEPETPPLDADDEHDQWTDWRAEDGAQVEL